MFFLPANFSNYSFHPPKRQGDVVGMAEGARGLRRRSSSRGEGLPAGRRRGGAARRLTTTTTMGAAPTPTRTRTSAALPTERPDAVRRGAAAAAQPASRRRCALVRVASATTTTRRITATTRGTATTTGECKFLFQIFCVQKTSDLLPLPYHRAGQSSIATRGPAEEDAGDGDVHELASRGGRRRW